ncbi:MAG: hypothetical protein ACLQKA_12865 [Bryobacteraceae bacterium]
MKLRIHTRLGVLGLTLALCAALGAASQTPARDAQSAQQPPAPAPVANPVPPEPAAPPAPRPAGPNAASVPAGLRVIVLQPVLRFEDVRSDSLLPRLAAAEAEYANALLDAARNATGSKATIVETDKLEPAGAEASAQLRELGSRLARGNVNDDATAALGRLAALDERYAVLVQFFRLRTGPGASWNSWNGAITSSMASTLMQSALISCRTGKVIWKGERLVRNKALRPAHPDFQKALNLVYQDFDVK